MIVTFCGHRELSDAEGSLRLWLKDTVENLILRGADVFYLGGYGDFDRMAASVVRELKKRCPQVESVLVLPYLDSKMDTSGCDSTTYPPLEPYIDALQSPIETAGWSCRRTCWWPM